MASWAVFVLANFAVAGFDVLRHRWSIVTPVTMVAGGVMFLAGDGSDAVDSGIRESLTTV
jgi:hypothetical protein